MKVLLHDGVHCGSLQTGLVTNVRNGAVPVALDDLPHSVDVVLGACRTGPPRAWFVLH